MPGAVLLFGMLCLFGLVAAALLPRFEHNAHVHFAVWTLMPNVLLNSGAVLLVHAVLVMYLKKLASVYLAIADYLIAVANKIQEGLYDLSDFMRACAEITLSTRELFMFIACVMTCMLDILWPDNLLVQSQTNHVYGAVCYLKVASATLWRDNLLVPSQTNHVYGAVCSRKFACGGRVHPHPVWVKTVNASVCKCIVPKTLLERSPAAGSSKGSPPPAEHGRSQAAGSSKSRPPTPVHGQLCDTVHPWECSSAGTAWAFTPTHCACECVLTSPARQPCNGRNYTHESAHSDPPPEHGRNGQNYTCVPPESTWYDTAAQVMHYAVACGVSAVGGAVWLLLTN